VGKRSDECAAVAGGLRLQIKYMPGLRLRANRLRTTQFAAFPLLHLTGFGAPVQDANDSDLDLHSMESTCGMVQPAHLLEFTGRDR
jgi:hypothetical protein